jgi:hypothetical protein
MSVYRITEFTSPDMAKAVEYCESMRDDVAAAGAESIDILSLGDGAGMVVAKYTTQADMEAATEINKAVFGKMVAAGTINGASISGKSGDVVFSF